MAVSFLYRNNVQILKFSDELSAEEFSQTLIKLEEKMIQNRKQFLFHLESFKNKDDDSRSKIIQLIRFCFDKKLQLALCLPNKYWSAYTIGTQAIAKMFNTETEALASFQSLTPEIILKAESPEEMKLRETDLLIKKYEIFHRPNELDPYSLQKMTEIYSQTPTLEAIQLLEKASLDIEKRTENIKRLEELCEQLSKQALEMSTARTTPLKESEFLARQKEIDTKRADFIAIQSQYEIQLAQLRTDLQQIDQRLVKLQARR